MTNFSLKAKASRPNTMEDIDILGIICELEGHDMKSFEEMITYIGLQ